MLHLLIHIVRLTFDLLNFAAKQAAKNQSLPGDREQQLDNALFTRRAISITQYIAIATKAMISDGKSIDDIKTILINRGLHEDHFEAVLNRAQQNYKKWFNETGKPTLNAFELYQQSTQSPQKTKPLVEITTHEGEDHALHFCALTDHSRYYEISGRSILQAAVNRALVNPSTITSNEETEIRQVTFARVGSNAVNPCLRVVTINQQTEAVYPYIRTELKTNFYTQHIIEWNNGDPIVEAEVDGNLNRTLPLSFFATDYAVNKHVYQTQTSIGIRLSALVLELSEANKNTNEINRQERGFWIDKKHSNKSYFSFEAVVLEIKEASIDRLSTGFVVTMKFGEGNAPLTPVIDTYISYNNIKAYNLTEGMLVKGTLWFQGEIAN